MPRWLIWTGSQYANGEHQKYRHTDYNLPLFLQENDLLRPSVPDETERANVPNNAIFEGITGGIFIVYRIEMGWCPSYQQLSVVRSLRRHAQRCQAVSRSLSNGVRAIQREVQQRRDGTNVLHHSHGPGHGGAEQVLLVSTMGNHVL